MSVLRRTFLEHAQNLFGVIRRARLELLRGKAVLASNEHRVLLAQLAPYLGARRLETRMQLLGRVKHRSVCQFEFTLASHGKSFPQASTSVQVIPRTSVRLAQETNLAEMTGEKTCRYILTAQV